MARPAILPGFFFDYNNYDRYSAKCAWLCTHHCTYFLLVLFCEEWIKVEVKVWLLLFAVCWSNTPLLPCLQAISAVESKVIRRKKPPVYRHRTVDTRVPYTQVKWPEQTPTTQKKPSKLHPVKFVPSYFEWVWITAKSTAPKSSSIRKKIRNRSSIFDWESLKVPKSYQSSQDVSAQQPSPGVQHFGCPEEEDACHQGGVWEVQGRVRRVPQETSQRDSKERGRKCHNKLKYVPSTTPNFDLGLAWHACRYNSKRNEGTTTCGPNVLVNAWLVCRFWAYVSLKAKILPGYLRVPTR